MQPHMLPSHIRLLEVTYGWISLFFSFDNQGKEKGISSLGFSNCNGSVPHWRE